MRTIPQAILDKVHSDQITDAFVVLLDFALNDVGDTHLRYARYDRDVTYDGNVYTAWQFDADCLGGTKSGTVPSYQLAIDDSTRVLRPHAIATHWFRGAYLTVVVVSVADLAVDYTWSTITYDILAASPREESILLTLGGANPTKIRFPPYRYWAQQCPYAADFPDNPLCGYSGVLTSCDGTLAQCVTRGRQTHWGGFLGLDSGTSILVIKR